MKSIFELLFDKILNKDGHVQGHMSSLGLTTYKINNFELFGGGNRRQVKGNNKGGTSQSNAQNQSTRNQSGSRGGVNRDLNLRLDLSLRKQASITRDIAS